MVKGFYNVSRKVMTGKVLVMTKDYFIQLADYNIWANNIVHSWFEKITDEQWEQPIVSSFESINATALHIARAETIWLDRLNNSSSPVWPPADFKGSKKETMEVWKTASQNFKSFSMRWTFSWSKLSPRLICSIVIVTAVGPR